MANFELEEEISMDFSDFNHWDMSSLDELLTSSQIWADDNNMQSQSQSQSHSHSPESLDSFICSPAVDPSPPPPPPPAAAAAQKPKRTPSFCTTVDPTKVSAPSILSFGSPDSPSDDLQLYSEIAGVVVSGHRKMKQKGERRRGYDIDDVSNKKAVKRSSSSLPRSASCSKEHIIAERRRRENISQKFIALSAIVPGLKKMDKASVLGDATKYVIQLQEKVKTLEEQQSTKKSIECATLVKKSPQHQDNEISSFGENFDHNHTEIEVKLSEKTALLKIHCKKHKGIMAKLFSEIENLNLTVYNVGVVPFSISSLDITVMAQVEEGFTLSVNYVLEKLHLAFKRFTETS